MHSQSQIVPAGTRHLLNILTLLTCCILILSASHASAQKNPQYGSMTACNAMTTGSPTYGFNGGDLNGFVPFVAANTWNTNIKNAPIDPNSSAITAAWAAAGGYKLHATFGSSPDNGGIPYIVVDSSETPSVPIHVIDYVNDSDVTVAPYPSGDAVPIEGDPTDCAGWPDTYLSDTHTLVVDRHTCWLYETFQTNRCNGMYDAASETIFDMTANANQSRPWGWTSGDAAGLSIFAGLVRYDEAASGVINHAFRFTMEPTEGDSHGGYFVLPASHAASRNKDAHMLPEGARLRLRANTPITSYSKINRAILAALKNYGMILADNGKNFYLIGAADARWDDSDLGNLDGATPITSADFDVIQMTPEYPGMDKVSAKTDYPGSAPKIGSFTSTATQVAPGSPVTFSYNVTGDTYDYIDNIGPVRLPSGSGSVTIAPTATQEYRLYAANTSDRTVSSPIMVTVAGSVVAPPSFTPPAGSYASNRPLLVTLNTTTAGDSLNLSGATTATYYYTTDGSAPTIHSTKYNGVSISVAKSETLKAIAVAPGYSSASAASSAAYTIGATMQADTPVFSLPSGTYSSPQTVYISDSTDGTRRSGNTIYFTTDGSTPTTHSKVFSNPPRSVRSSGPITVSATETIKAIAVAKGYTNSAVASVTYTIQ
jgi:hypothetical protein